MKKIISALAATLCLSLSLIGSPIQDKVFRKIQIRHADPALIMLILSGNTWFGMPPEISTWSGARFGFSGWGGGSSFGGGSGGGFSGYGGGSIGSR